ncbi:hypothetical protein [Terriglobus sp.]
MGLSAMHVLLARNIIDRDQFDAAGIRFLLVRLHRAAIAEGLERGTPVT